MRRLRTILWLGLKELRSLAADPVLALFMVYAFSAAIYSQATGITYELRNASVSILDEDRSQLSARLRDALLPPFFRPPEPIGAAEVGPRMDTARDTFVLDIPPNFQRDLAAGRHPELQLNVDATAMSQAGIGAGYLQQIVAQEIATFLGRTETVPVALRMRTAFNPNNESGWFVGVVGLINNVTMLAVLLAGAAVIREREHGTLDHLLVMPVSPLEIALAKLWSNGLVITVATGLSLWFVVHEAVGMPIAGSVPLFLLGVALYLFFATAVGLLLGTAARSMPQLGLLFILVVLPMNILSGGNSPFESMPRALQIVMSAFPSTHFVAFAQAILYRGAGLDIVWPQFLATGGVGGLVMAVALLRFRRSIAQAVG
ncbi:ABC transporter permease [Paracraurococcus lichenis]|uniref:ABC transporter permease n=1 Tax=Paracraurococcus lichenis TaxID=3064888 RepID=A0ABT9E7L7_9PROT|nr:ABC transporter permease [Paracraurococcus sp. LOR1-02]MDO9712141.1 ABC transporter permease [Paracraurococcus sp. LOR1-02]